MGRILNDYLCRYLFYITMASMTILANVDILHNFHANCMEMRVLQCVVARWLQSAVARWMYESVAMCCCKLGCCKVVYGSVAVCCCKVGV